MAATTVLLMPFDGDDGSSTIVDVSLSPKTITSYGSPVLSTAQKKYGSASLYLDGSSSITTSSVGILAAEDFTIELWIRPSSIASTTPIIEKSGVRAGLVYLASGALYWLGPDFETTGILTANTWSHVAVSRASGTVRVFKDGALVGSGTDSAAFDILCLGIGIYDQRFVGYIDDLRVTRGSALYLSTFTPPDAFQYFVPGNIWSVYSFHPGLAAAVSLLYSGFKYGDSTTWSLGCDDAVGFAWATEDKGSAFFDPDGALYLTYGVANSDTVARFGNTSLFFPSGAYVTLPSGSGYVPPYVNFSLEFWINFASIVSDTTIVRSDDILIYARGTTLGTSFGNSPTVTLGVWHHMAVCRKANILRFYLNGTKFAESVHTTAVTVQGFSYSLARGSFYLDSIGFSSGYGHYGAVDFAPPSLPFFNPPTSSGVRLQLDYDMYPGEASGSRITPAEADGQWDKTVLLLRGGGAVGSKNIVDSKGRTIVNQADTIYSDAQSKYDDTSIYFNGSSAKLVIDAARNLDLIYGDFTIELWVHPTRMQGSSLLDKWGDVRRSYALWMLDTGAIRFGFYDLASVSDTFVYGPSPVTSGTWSFISVCRYGNDYRVWVNGVGGDIVTTTKTPNPDSDRMYGDGEYRSWDVPIIIGANGEDGTSPGTYFKGFIENLRITNGYARYANADIHPVPAGAFLASGSGSDGDPYWTDVVLLCHFDEPNGTVYNIRDARGHVLTAGQGCSVTSNGMYGGALWHGALGAMYGSEFDLSDGDFTIEAWVSGSVGGGYVCGNNSKNETKGWQVVYEPLGNPSDSRTGNFLKWEQWTSSGVHDIAISTLYPFYGGQTRWQHIAVVRSGNDLTVFVDGIGNTTTITRRPAYSEETVYLGGYPGVSFGFPRFEEVRITRVARYSTNFRVPTGKFPETVFSYGNAVLTSYYDLIPAQTQSASTVPGATILETYYAVPPLIIGRPSVYGVDVTYELGVLAPSATGGEGIPEAVAIVDTLSTLHAHQHAQIFYVNDVAIAQPVRGISTRIGVTDVASAAVASVALEDALQFGDSRPVTSLVAKTITSAFALADSTPVGVYGVVISTAINFSDSAAQAVHQTVGEAVVVSSGVNTRQTSAAADALVVSGSSGYAGHVSAADSVGFVGALANRSNLRTSVAEAVTFHSALALDVVLYVTVSDDVALADVPEQTLLFQAIIQDHVQFKAFFASPAYTTWAMNTRNAAVTQYANFNFNSFAKIGPRYLGANDQGLYWLDGDDDAGRAVNSRITTGVIQPNGNKLAGVQYAYLGMRGDGQFVITVTDEAGGSYSYSLTGSSMETARVAFGRGFKTRYFTFSLESKGQDFDIDSVEFITTEMARKIQR